MNSMAIISGLLGGLIAVGLVEASEKRGSKKGFSKRTPPPSPGDIIEDPFEKLHEICALLDKLGAKYEVHRDDDPNDEFYNNSYPHEKYGYAVYINLQNPYSDNKRMGFEIIEESGISLGFDYYIRNSYSENGFREIMKNCEQILTNEVCVESLFLGGVWKCYRVIPRLDLEDVNILEQFAGDVSPKEVKRLSERYGAEIRFDFWNPKFDKVVTIERKETV